MAVGTQPIRQGLSQNCGATTRVEGSASPCHTHRARRPGRHQSARVHKALKQAKRWGLVTNNAASDVYPPKVHKDEVTPLTREEARRLLDTVRGDRLEALYVVAVQSGLRQGELLALRWEDVDLEACTVQVRRTIARDGGKLAVAPTKTAKVGWAHGQAHSGRYRGPQRPLRAAVGGDRPGNDKWQENGLVFCTSKGTLINPTDLRRGGPLPRSYNVPGLHR